MFMSNDKIGLLCKHLEQEIQWITELNSLLDAEKELLANRQFQSLEECAERKQALSIQLEQSANERLAINPTGLRALLDACSNELVEKAQALNQKLAGLLEICHVLNSINGQVIANNLYVRQELMNTMSGNGENAVGIYNAHGNLQPNTIRKHHQKA